MNILINKNFYKIIKDVEKVTNDSHLMFHPLKSNSEIKIINRYDGFMNCGPMCLVVLKLLVDNNYKCKVYKSSIGYGSYLEDHVFIYCNNKIVDPTYKQFLRDTRGINDKYQNYIYQNLDTFFVGNIDELKKIYLKAYKLNQETYSNYNSVDLDDINNFWCNNTDITSKFYNNLDLLS